MKDYEGEEVVVAVVGGRMGEVDGVKDKDTERGQRHTRERQLESESTSKGGEKTENLRIIKKKSR